MALDDLNLTGPEGGADAGAERQFPFSRDPRLRPGEAKVIKERFKCGTRYYEECAAEPFKRCRELYIGYHWPRSRKWRQHVPVINYLRYVVDTMAASLAHTPGDVDLKPLDETGELNLPASRRALRWGDRVSHAHRETKRALRDTFTYGLGVCLTTWAYEEEEAPAVEGRPQTGDEVLAAVENGEPLPPPVPPAEPLRDEPCVKRLDPRCFRVSPEANGVLEEAAWCGYVELRPLDEVKADPRFKKGLTRKLKGTCKSLKGYLGKEAADQEEEAIGSDVKRVELWHYYEKRRKIHVVFAEELNEPLMVRAWDWLHGQYPFDVLMTPRLEDEFYTELPPMLQWEHMQREIELARAQLAKHRSRFNRVFVAQNGALSKNAEKALEAGEDGTILTVPQGMDARTAVHAMESPQLNPAIYEAAQTALMDLRTLSTLDQYELGGAPSKRLTTSEVQAIQSSGGALQQDMQQAFEQFYASILHKVFSLMQQYAERTQSLPIYNPNDPNQIMGWQQWNRDDIRGQYHFEVVVGSTRQKKQQGEIEEKGFLLQSLAPYMQAGVNPLPLIKQLLQALPEIKNVEEIVPPPSPAGPPPGGDAMGGGPAPPLPGGEGEIPPELLQMALMGQGG